MVEGVEVLAKAVEVGGIGDAEAPVADDVGEGADLVDAGRELVEVQLGGVDGLAVEVEVVDEEFGWAGLGSAPWSP